ncbi:hypothetical protein [Sphingomonas sp. ID0503]|uniref:hypothetical protein n=1 Tax=Sphingomonas sp. ID0503 TaxID=3399691 RepID=UPI003AFA5DF7
MDYDTMIRRLLERAPTADDYKRINQLTLDLPDELSRSPGAIAEIILRAEHLRQFEQVVKQASFDAQQRVHADLSQRIDAAALAALAKIRDRMPVDAADRLIRMLRWSVCWTLVVAITFAAAGWMLASRRAEQTLAEAHALNEELFKACMDEAAGAALRGPNRRQASPLDVTTYVQTARECAASYADRRAAGS